MYDRVLEYCAERLLFILNRQRTILALTLNVPIGFGVVYKVTDMDFYAL